YYLHIDLLPDYCVFLIYRESIEMVRRYAQLAPNHLTEHARQIDSIFAEDVPNVFHEKISARGGS
ncbi:TPA: hypothetical protein ND640_003481, partial [Klebsiella michiganensis]|nr:hypothetical protein [Klebsiella michiganensis]HCD7940900.1 hypothetical protein [Klebsiella michiganensis]HCD8525946.1 hypothetical protein [Klebsiella michiganensis]